MRGRKWAYGAIGLEPKRGEVRKSLEWLAKTLKQNYQTELLIEKMQPGWLDTKQQKWQYRLIFGLILGLILGLIFGLFCLALDRWRWISGFWYGLTGGLMSGLFYGLNFGLGNIEPMEAFRIPQSSQVILTMAQACIQGLKRGLKRGLELGLIYGLIVGLMAGMIYGLGTGLSSGRMSGVIYGLIIGLIAGLVFGAMMGVAVGMTLGSIVGPMGGLMGEMKQELVVRSRPNQGIWNSFRNMIWAILLTLLTSVIYRILYVYLDSQPFQNLAGGIGWISWIITICISFSFGSAIPFIQHFTLRFILALNHLTPWRYVRFLSYCTERRLLQRVGGRYRFIHRELLEHFAL
jgi:hypothetical protein